MQDLFIEFLPPWVETGLQPAFYDRESGTVLQQTARMYAKVNELVKAVNGMDKIIKEYIEYIDNYFKNLDVQEEINVKLDDMAENGQLEEIISLYLELGSVIAFNTTADLKGATNVVDGSTCIRLGDTAYDDGKVNLYKIRELQEGDVVDEDKILALTNSDTLIAERIDDIKFTQLANLIEGVRDELDDAISAPDDLCKAELAWSYSINSYYSMVKIPKDKFTFTIIPYTTTGFDGSYKYVNEHPDSIYINGQLTSPTIIDGVVTTDSVSQDDQYWYILGLDNNGDVKYTKDIHRTLSGTDLLAMGYKQAFGVWSPIVLNGVNYVPEDDLDTSDDNYDYIVNQKQPRSILGYDADYWYLIVIDGRLARSKGTTYAGMQTLLQELNIPNAFNMDGGSNTQLWLSNPTTNLSIRDNSRYVRGYTSNNIVSLIKFNEIGA